ncbi:hypothetical protein ACHAXR_001875 [Thalassiosira sp. AJA248-18]
MPLQEVIRKEDMADAHKNNPPRQQKNSGKKRNNHDMDDNCNNRKSDVQLSKALSWLLRHNAPSLGLKLAPDGFVPLENVLSLNHPRFRKKDGQPKYTVEDITRMVQNNDKQRFRLEYKDVLTEGTASNNEDVMIGNDQSETEEVGNSSNGIVEGTHTKVLCIRANQGHSVKGLQPNQLLTPLTKEELSHPNLSIIHGTTRKAWEDHIQHEGLSRMKRNHIHFATGLPAPPQSSAADAKKKQHNCDDNKKNSTTTPISGMRSSSEIYIYINGSKCANDGGIPFYRSDNGVILTAGVNEEGVLPVEYFQKVLCAFSGKVIMEAG